MCHSQVVDQQLLSLCAFLLTIELRKCPLQAFHAPGDLQQRKITRQQLKAATKIQGVAVFTISGGRLTASHKNEFTEKFTRLMRR